MRQAKHSCSENFSALSLLAASLSVACGLGTSIPDPPTETLQTGSTTNVTSTSDVASMGETSLLTGSTFTTVDISSLENPSTTSIDCESTCDQGMVDMMVETCDPINQDCPTGMKCSPFATNGGSFWNSTRCLTVADMPAQIGEACTVEENPYSGIDNCDVGMFCWNGDGDGYTCAPLCGGIPEDLQCPSGFFCSVISEVLAVCELPSCDPLLQDCVQPSDVCVPNIRLYDDWCLPDVSGDSGQINAPCEEVNACDKGLVCIPAEFAGFECDLNVWGCCQPFCQINEDECVGADQECLPYFDISEAGVCQTP